MRQRGGANAIEFALCMPVFIVIVAGMVDFGWLFFHRSAVDAAVYHGCRQGAIVDPLVGNPQATAEAEMVLSLEDNGVPCAGTCVPATYETGTTPNRALQCELSVEFTPLFGLVTDSMTIEGLTQVRYEWQREAASIPP